MKSIKLLIAFAFITTFLTAQNNWAPTNGPYGGICNILKNINNEVYAGTNCGIYSTNDDGVTWKNKCAGLMGVCKTINDIELLGNTLIAGSNADGIYLSNDLGDNWTQSNTGLIDPFLDQHIYDVLVNGSDILIGTLNGVYKSINQGLSWTPSNIGISEPNNVNAVRFAKNGSNIFLQTSNDLYKSTDNGFTWLDLNNSIGAYGFSLVSFGGSIYVLGDQGVYKSSNNGVSWALLNFNFPSTLTSLFMGGSKLYCSSGGTTYVSSDGGVSWIIVTNKVFNTILDANNKTFGGNNGGVYSWVNGGSSVINSGLGGSSATNVLFQDGSTMYAGNNNGIYKSTDNGNLWFNLGLSLPLNSIVTCITKSGGNIVIGTKGNGVYLSNDNGNTWTQSNNGLNINGVFYSDITALFQNNGRLYMGAKENILFYDYATLFISDNNGVSWTQSATGLEQNCNVSSICNFGQYIVIGTFDQFSPASFIDGVYLSTNNGASWLYDGLSQPIVSVCSNSTGYFATSADVVHSTIDMGNSWNSFDVGGGSSSYTINTIANLDNVLYTVQSNGIANLNNGNWTYVSSSGLGGNGAKGICSNQSGTIFVGNNGVVSYGGGYYILNNGVSKYTGSTNNLDEIQSKINYSIFPNPTTSKISVKSNAELIGSQFIIYDQLGKAVKSGIITSENTEIDLSNLIEGMYLLKVGAEMKESFKIIKQ